MLILVIAMVNKSVKLVIAAMFVVALFLLTSYFYDSLKPFGSIVIDAILPKTIRVKLLVLLCVLPIFLVWFYVSSRNKRSI